jgi:hypothetical protein
MDIKITMARGPMRAPSIEKEAEWMADRGRLWYPLPGRPKQAHHNCWVYFIRAGEMAARARAVQFKPASQLRQLVGYDGEPSRSKAPWSVACSTMELATQPIPHRGFQGFRYVTPEESGSFENAFQPNRESADIEAVDAVYDGALRSVMRDVFERDRRARAACIRHHGMSCVICGFDFEETYGPRASGCIHIHHLTPLATVRKRHPVDPLRDLRPVCPNCHSVIHLDETPLSITEMKALLKSAKRRR